MRQLFSDHRYNFITDSVLNIEHDPEKEYEVDLENPVFITPVRGGIPSRVNSISCRDTIIVPTFQIAVNPTFPKSYIQKLVKIYSLPNVLGEIYKFGEDRIYKNIDIQLCALLREASLADQTISASDISPDALDLAFILLNGSECPIGAIVCDINSFWKMRNWQHPDWIEESPQYSYMNISEWAKFKNIPVIVSASIKGAYVLTSPDYLGVYLIKQKITQHAQSECYEKNIIKCPAPDPDREGFVLFTEIGLSILNQKGIVRIIDGLY